MKAIADYTQEYSKDIVSVEYDCTEINLDFDDDLKVKINAAQFLNMRDRMNKLHAEIFE